MNVGDAQPPYLILRIAELPAYGPVGHVKPLCLRVGYQHAVVSVLEYRLEAALRLLEPQLRHFLFRYVPGGTYKPYRFAILAAKDLCAGVYVYHPAVGPEVTVNDFKGFFVNQRLFDNRLCLLAVIGVHAV